MLVARLVDDGAVQIITHQPVLPPRSETKSAETERWAKSIAFAVYLAYGGRVSKEVSDSLEQNLKMQPSLKMLYCEVMAMDAEAVGQQAQKWINESAAAVNQPAPKLPANESERLQSLAGLQVGLAINAFEDVAGQKLSQQQIEKFAAHLTQLNAKSDFADAMGKLEERSRAAGITLPSISNQVEAAACLTILTAPDERAGKFVEFAKIRQASPEREPQPEVRRKQKQEQKIEVQQQTQAQERARGKTR